MWNEMRLTLLFEWDYDGKYVTKPKYSHGGVLIKNNYWSVFGLKVTSSWQNPVYKTIGWVKAKWGWSFKQQLLGHRKYRWRVKWSFDSKPQALLHHLGNSFDGYAQQDFTANGSSLSVGENKGMLNTINMFGNKG
jgi:hypothetical protein